MRGYVHGPGDRTGVSQMEFVASAELLLGIEAAMSMLHHDYPPYPQRHAEERLSRGVSMNRRTHFCFCRVGLSKRAFPPTMQPFHLDQGMRKGQIHLLLPGTSEYLLDKHLGEDICVANSPVGPRL